MLINVPSGCEKHVVDLQETSRTGPSVHCDMTVVLHRPGYEEPQTVLIAVHAH